MFTERNIVIVFERLYYHLKNLHWNFFVPLLAADIFLPFICLITYNSEKANAFFSQTVIEFSMIIIPLFSVWWVIFINKDYIEGKGNELLFVCRNKIKTLDTLIPFLLFFIGAVIQFIFYAGADSALKYEPLKLFCISFFYYGLVQLTVYLTKSISVTLLVALLYTIANPLIVVTANYSGFPIYYISVPMSRELLYHNYFPMLLFGILFLIISIVLNKKCLKFN